MEHGDETPQPHRPAPLTLPVTHHSPRATVLIIEDDPAVAGLERDILESNGYKVFRAGSGALGRELAVEHQPDLIIMDLMLPDIDGLVLLTNLKTAVTSSVIICTAARRRWDAVLGLKLGADDYVSKPFDVDELEARVEAVLRRRQHVRVLHQPAPAPDMESPEASLGDLTLQPARHQASVGGHSLKLTPVEYNLLAALSNHPETVLSREELAQVAWGRQEPAQTRTVDVYIRRLRGKLAQFSDSDVPLIVSTRGMGYRLIASRRRFHAA